MLRSSKPAIVSWGAVSALGRSAEHIGFFLRAGQNQVRLTPFIDQWGERVQMSFVPYLERNLAGVERMVSLAREALDPLLIGWKGSLRIALALPERFAAKAFASELNVPGQAFATQFIKGLHGSFPNVEVDFFPSGRAGGALALQRAVDWLGNSQSGIAIAGGVDSYYEWPILEQLQKQDRVLTEDNLDGFIPGEGAAFLALSDAPGNRPVARLAGLGSGVEPAPLLSKQTSRAVGMTNAMNAATKLLRTDVRQSRYWLVDLTHEAYGIKEFQTIIARFGGLMGTNAAIETPLREIGNVGAAALPLFATLACEAWRREYAADQICISLVSSDNGLRGALVLEQL